MSASGGDTDQPQHTVPHFLFVWISSVLHAKQIYYLSLIRLLFLVTTVKY